MVSPRQSWLLGSPALKGAASSCPDPYSPIRPDPRRVWTQTQAPPPGPGSVLHSVSALFSPGPPEESSRTLVSPTSHMGKPRLGQRCHSRDCAEQAPSPSLSGSCSTTSHPVLTPCSSGSWEPSHKPWFSHPLNGGENATAAFRGRLAKCLSPA